MDRMWRWYERLRGLLLKSRVEREILDEMQFHIEQETELLIERGLEPKAARRQAMLAFGGIEAQRTRAREARWGRHADLMVRDTHYALRLLVKNPGLSAAMLLTLALGIGGSAAVFGIVQGVLMAPLPYADPDGVAWVSTRWEGTPEGRISPAEYLDYRDDLDAVFSHFGVYSFGTATVTGDGEAVALPVAWMSSETLDALGVSPILGRGFTDQEDESGAAVMLIGEGLWRSRFAGDPDVLGRDIVVNGSARQIIGVVPASFRLPESFFADRGQVLFGPQGIDATEVDDRGSHYLSGVARLRDDVDFQTAAGTFESVSSGFRRRYPNDYPESEGFTGQARPIAERIRGPVKAPIAILAAAVSLVLSITCFNVAGLLLARAERRRREFGLRAALGAGRGRIVVQVMIESLVLAVLGGLLGVLTARAILATLLAELPSGLSWLSGATVDARVLALALGLALVTGLVFGIAPARRLGRQALDPSRLTGGRFASGRRDRRLRRLLSAAQVGVALALLVGAGVLLRSFDALRSVDPGFRTDGVVTARVGLPFVAYPENEDLTGFFAAFETALAAIPGVEAAGLVTNLPLASRLGDMDFEIEGRPLAAGASEPFADWQVATPGYFRAIGSRLIAGRAIEPSDRADTRGVVVVSTTFVERYFPNESALGKRMRLLGDGTGPAIAEIVGIVEDVKHNTLSQPATPQMYFAHRQFRFWSSRRAVSAMSLVVASESAPETLRPAIVSALAALDPGLPLVRFQTLEEVRRSSVALPRLLSQSIAAFALVALILAAVGIYGIVAQLVASRIPEIGVRLALGAQRRSIAWMVLREGLALTVAGLAVGGVLTLIAARGLEQVLFGVSPFDPTTFATVAGTLAITALGACYLPARRATRVEPAHSLRAE